MLTDRRAHCLLAGAVAVFVPVPAAAQAAPAFAAGAPIELGLILDGAVASDALALGARERGLAPGHNELTLGGRIDDRFAGRLTAVMHRHEGETELELEEAYIETTALPAGLQLRGGRFLAAVGYLNELHLHSDDFVERPLLHRAFLGGHWFDDGVRLSWVAPTRLYWRTTLEAFTGASLLPDAPRRGIAGAWTLGTQVGGDVGIEHSWQAGLSYLRNRLDTASLADGHGHGHAGDPDDHDADGHDHAHGSRYAGRHMLVANAVWKWAPDGNNRARQLRVSAEYARVQGLNAFAGDRDLHEAWYLSMVYRFAPQWEAGVRLDELRVREPHGNHFHSGHLQEASVSLAWKPTHFSTLRLQWTSQRDRGGFDGAGDALFLQYVMSLGAHGAHPF